MIPETIQVGPYRIRIVADDGDRMPTDKQFAHFRACRMVIAVGGEFCTEKQRLSVLHEVMHAVYHATGHDTEKLSEEDVCTYLTPTLLDTLRRNPALVAYLTEESADA